MYNLLKNADEETIVKSVNGINWSIPIDEANTDYQEYLEWVAEGNKAMVIGEDV